MDVRLATAADRDRVDALYATFGYRRTIGPAPVIFVAEIDRELVGVVRLEPEHGTTVLRGMRIRPDFQRQGIGAAMLAAVRQHLGGRECYCIAYAHLAGFYGRIGFGSVPVEAAPDFLRERYEQYRRERDDMVLLWRPEPMGGESGR